uniref:Galectin n=1 Tax=Meloidogyne javanica TaxID=6303 RepID=A0A915M2C3_MELJA
MFSRYFSKFSRLSATIFLIVFNGFVNSAGYSTIGEGRHTIENGTVTLANGSRIATREDVYEYQIQPLACNLDIDAEGNIILDFSWYTITAYEGCTVDLVTEIGSDKETNVVEFTVSIKHYEELNKCMSCGGDDWMSGNIIPFVFNIDSDEFDELVQMPPSEWPCQEPWNKLWSSSEIRICYSGDEIQIGSFIDTPGPLNFWPWCHRDENRTFENLKQLDFNVEINGETFVVNHTDYNFSICKSQNFEKPFCSPVKPKVWPIVGNTQLEGKGLLAFSLLPKYQIIFHRGCDLVSLKFPSKKYSLLTTLPPKPLTTMNGTIDEIITLFKSNNGDFDYESSTSDLSQNLTNQLNSSSTQTNKTSIIAKTNETTVFNTSTNGTLTGRNLTDGPTIPTEETTINGTYSGTPQIIPAIEKEHSVEEGVKEKEDKSNEEVDKTERETEEDSMKIIKDKKKHPRFDETQRETKRETIKQLLFDKTQRSESEEKSLKEEEKLDATSKTVSEEEVTIENKTLLSVYGPSQFGNGSKLKEAKVEEEKSKKEEKVKQKVEEGKTTKEVEQKGEDKNNNKNSNVAL